MKFFSFLILILLILVKSPFAQISNNYPHDIGIENDPRVLFVEKFNDNLSNILDRYDEVLNPSGMFLDIDVPDDSSESFSIRIESLQGQNTGGHLYKAFSPGFNGTVFLRYYVKYPSSSIGYTHHEGVWFGGYNPIISWPYPRAGYCGLGDSRLSIAFEPVWQMAGTIGMDTYLYWGDMRSYDGGNTCYGNTMITQGRKDYGQPPSPDEPVCTPDEWMCVEVMIKLNNPVSAFNGELKVWLNGTELGHWGPGFPNGHWLKDKWYNNPDDPPFEGFRWRTVEDLNINWIWLEYYHQPSGPNSYLKFSNVVMAKEYIGPIYKSNPVSVQETKINNTIIRAYPNPTSGLIFISNNNKPFKARLFNILGQEVLTLEHQRELDISTLYPGVYFMNVEIEQEQYVLKIIKK